MQTQPRGKKRGASENVTVGGKKVKKGEEEPKPFVCAIYRRDIASFLPREKIQQWRQTSSHSNASLIEFPSELPRFEYFLLTVIFASADRWRVKKDGFLHHQSDDYSMHGKEFNSIFKFRFCCRDVRVGILGLVTPPITHRPVSPSPALQDSASKLVGQRLFPNKPDNEGVAFKLDVKLPRFDRFSKMVACRVPNLLTKKTAPAMLHFLHHLSQACFEHIEIEPGATADAAECAFNPLVRQAIPKFRLRGVKFGRDGRELSLTVKMASEMRIRYNLIFYHSYSFALVIPQLLDFIANGRQLDKGLELQGSLFSQDVDHIIKHFEEDMHSLEGAIRDVCHTNTWYHGDAWYYGYGGGWPARCPREAATQVTERDDGTVDYRFDYTNEHSGEPFSLLLGTLGAKLCKYHLTFGSA